MAPMHDRSIDKPSVSPFRIASLAMIASIAASPAPAQSPGFRVRPAQQWSQPTSLADHISLDNSSASNPRVAMNPQGDAVIVWQAENYGTGFECIYKAEYRNGLWTLPSGFDDYINPNGSDASEPDVAMNASGDIVISWRQRESLQGLTFQTFKSHFLNGVWIHPQSLTDNCSPDYYEVNKSPRVAMDEMGNIVIAWIQNGPAGMYMSEYRNGVWTHPASIAATISPQGGVGVYTSFSDPFAVAMAPNGNAVIAWSQGDANPITTQDQVFMSEYRNGVWTHPADLNDNISPDGTAARFPTVAVTNSVSIISWSQKMPNGSTNAFKSEYRNGVWTHPATLNDYFNFTNGPGVSKDPSVFVDAAGGAFIAYQQNWLSAPAGTGLFTSSYANNQWTHATSTSESLSPTTNWAGPYYVNVAGNSNMRVIAWLQPDAPTAPINWHVYKAYTTYGGPWVTPSSISDHVTLGDVAPIYNSAPRPQVAVSATTNNALIVWMEADATGFLQVFISHYK